MPTLQKATPNAGPYNMIHKLVSLHRDELWHLEKAEISVVWVEPDMKKDGRLRAASAQKVPPLWALLTGLDFIIKLSSEVWDREMTDKQREAVILHELRHCGLRKEKKSGQPLFVDDTPVPLGEDDMPTVQDNDPKLAYCIVPHDAEIFLKDMDTYLPGIERVKEHAQQVFDFAEV